MALLGLGAGKGATAAHRLLITGLGSKPCCAHVVILLARDGIFLEQLGITLLLTACLFKTHTGLIYASIVDADVVACGGHARGCGVATCQLALKVSLSLC